MDKAFLEQEQKKILHWAMNNPTEVFDAHLFSALHVAFLTQALRDYVPEDTALKMQSDCREAARALHLDFDGVLNQMKSECPVFAPALKRELGYEENTYDVDIFYVTKCTHRQQAASAQEAYEKAIENNDGDYKEEPDGTLESVIDDWNPLAHVRLVEEK